MVLFEILRISSDCYLCGCPTNSFANSSAKGQSSILPIKPDISGIVMDAPIVCHYCHQHLPVSSNTCITCGLPLTKALARNSMETNQSIEIGKNVIPCGECLKHSPPFDRTISGFHYEAPVSDFITQLKYSAQFQLLPLLCEYLIGKIIQGYQATTLPSLIIPVPLHPNKLVRRGFNQSQLIADRVGKALKIGVLSTGIHRIKETKAQSGLDSVERKSNVRNAFQIKLKLPTHIAIVDDVITTGMTVAELAKQARLHGAKQIDVWCLARAYDLYNTGSLTHKL